MNDNERLGGFFVGGLCCGVVVAFIIAVNSCQDQVTKTIKEACGDPCTRGAQCGAFTCTATGWVP